jgi:hypothetical protein
MTTADKDSNVVVAFKPSDIGEPPMTIKRVDFNFCKHTRIEADDHTRTLICHECNATLDPYNFVRQSAITIQQAWERHAYTKKELAELVDRVANLKKEEARIKSRINTARSKLPVISTRGSE